MADAREQVFSLATSVRDEFPPGFWTLTQLQTLDLATAHIDHLPDEIGQLVLHAHMHTHTHTRTRTRTTRTRTEMYATLT
jgi:hypothetical protein